MGKWKQLRSFMKHMLVTYAIFILESNTDTKLEKIC